ncbi:hypothetical protein Pint_14133 [Pistacia integerrima]|uniref:Uncharacterized protein n=1 Tax=Pistacia integerrima TaxID=434235 RepID=A0ACC0Y623_9ROSI|nr:hypothetical protein Pint_14133 [Pistacia integerrima]
MRLEGSTLKIQQLQKLDAINCLKNGKEDDEDADLKVNESKHMKHVRCTTNGGNSVYHDPKKSRSMHEDPLPNVDLWRR